MMKMSIAEKIQGEDVLIFFCFEVEMEGRKTGIRFSERYKKIEEK